MYAGRNSNTEACGLWKSFLSIKMWTYYSIFSDNMVQEMLAVSSCSLQESPPDADVY